MVFLSFLLRIQLPQIYSTVRECSTYPSKNIRETKDLMCHSVILLEGGVKGREKWMGRTSVRDG